MAGTSTVLHALRDGEWATAAQVAGRAGMPVSSAKTRLYRLERRRKVEPSVRRVEGRVEVCGEVFWVPRWELIWRLKPEDVEDRLLARLLRR
jgi:hypothetical protein